MSERKENNKSEPPIPAELNETVLDAGKKIFDFLNGLQTAIPGVSAMHISLSNPNKFNPADARFEAWIGGAPASSYTLGKIKEKLSAGEEVIFASRAQAMLFMRISESDKRSLISYMRHGGAVKL